MKIAVIGCGDMGGALAQALAFKGDIARCSGWVERSHRMLDDADLDCV